MSNVHEKKVWSIGAKLNDFPKRTTPKESVYISISESVDAVSGNDTYLEFTINVTDKERLMSYQAIRFTKMEAEELVEFLQNEIKKMKYLE